MFGLSTSQGFGYGVVGVEENHNRLCRGLWVWQSLTFKGYGFGFLSKSTPLNMWVMWVYIVCIKRWCIKYKKNSKIKCFTGISREGLTSKILVKTSCHHLSWLFVLQSYAEHMASHHKKPSCELPAKTPLIFNLSWVFIVSLIHNPYNEIPHKI